ncbi:MAG: right-handed parallel beta-helix repeat-containing protein [Lactobacillaceae bacterium]|jgi:polygalacturonase|nr:right-handed parallel beta-helix repeat-containing protein [Lactobacillaceae bacterium]
MQLTVSIDDYQNFQQALDMNNHAEQLEVIVTTGVHKTGPIDLRSNLTITFEDDGVLQFDDDPSLYQPIWTRWEGIECYAMHPLLYAAGQSNITIRGNGRIDGSGQGWWEKFRQIEAEDRTLPREDYELRLAELNPDYKTRTGGGGRPSTQFLRPPLVQFWKCQNINLQDFTIENSPFWTLHLLYSSDIVINNMTFRNPADAINTDAMDIDSSQNVKVTNCLLDVGDDGVTLKSGSGEDGLKIGIPTENVTVDNCKILASHGGIAIGSETAAGIKDVFVKNCAFEGTRRGIRLKSRRTRGGTIQNIQLDNLQMDSCWCPITLEMYFAPGVLPDEEATVLSMDEQPVTPATPHIRDVKITNVNATNVRATAAFIVGLPEAPIENVTIENFDWSLASEENLLPTERAEETGGRFHDDDRGIKTVNVEHLQINGANIKSITEK